MFLCTSGVSNVIFTYISTIFFIYDIIAKVYSNLAAALCKINKYDDALNSAKDATKVNPKWAKGHWRLGSIYELKKNFLAALNNYEKAVENDTDESTAVYKKAFKRMLDRLGCEKNDGGEGYWSVQLPVSTCMYLIIGMPTFRYSYAHISNHIQPTSLSVQSGDEYPAFVAWERVMKKTNNLKDMNKLFPQYIREGETITSLQWMSQGMHYWYSAMMCQLGEMAGFANDKEMGAKLESLKMQMTNGSISRSTFDTKRYELTGCPPSQGDEFQGLLEGLIHLGGDTIPLEMGSGKFIPSPEWLKMMMMMMMMTDVHIVVLIVTILVGHWFKWYTLFGYTYEQHSNWVIN